MTNNSSYSFALSPKLAVRMETVGESKEPILIVDDVLQEPETMVKYARNEVEFQPAWSTTGGFPGLRAPAPLNYVEQIGKNLAPTISRAWGLGNAKLSRATCFLALVTLQARELKPFQTVPHVDTTNPLDFAMLHYFCHSAFGGTAFYRHKATGLELIQDRDDDNYRQIRNSELTESHQPADFIREDSAEYVQIGRVAARYNRLVIYRSQLLHSGMIPKNSQFSSDPSRGRLTTNVFISFRAP